MSRTIIVANRLPVTFSLGKSGLEVHDSVGGLATAVRGVHAATEGGEAGVWVGWPGDVTRLDGNEKAELGRELAERRLVPVPISPGEVQRYYEGYSNGVIWPLFHYMPDRLPLDGGHDWETYARVNERFADVVTDQYRPGDRIWIHDYHLMLLPRLLRKRLPEARIGFFLHIPFPSYEVFRILDRRDELLEGLMGADLVGFHTISYARHFSRSLMVLLGARIDVDRADWEGRSVAFGAFPIGIDTEHFKALAADPQVNAQAAKIRAGVGGRRLLVGIDRLDYTKGVPHRLLAMDRLLEIAPEWRRKIRLVQVAAPSREKVESYVNLRSQVEQLVGRINGRWGGADAVPIHYIHRGLDTREVTAYYKAADVMIVNPLRDGMNLVAKEFAATRDDGDGVLVLSEFAGAASHLPGAVVVHPYDIDGTARGLRQALEMNEEDRRSRMGRLRERVFANDVKEWANRFLSELDRTAPRGITLLNTAERSDELLTTIAATPHVALLLDYDGTLVPFAPRPELARPDPGLLQLLTDLEAVGFRVDVVSGRSRADLEGFLGSTGLGIHAEHGLWYRPPKAVVWKREPVVSTGWMDAARSILDDFRRRTPGSFVETKEASLAWHWRQADPEFGARQARELSLHLSEMLAELPTTILVGNHVVEVRATGIHKGLTVRRLAAEMGETALLVAAGDDRTDEDLFAALPPRGIAIHVGGGHTRATYEVADIEAMRSLLRQLIDARRAAGSNSGLAPAP